MERSDNKPRSFAALRISEGVSASHPNTTTTWRVGRRAHASLCLKINDPPVSLPRRLRVEPVDQFCFVSCRVLQLLRLEAATRKRLPTRAKIFAAVPHQIKALVWIGRGRLERAQESHKIRVFAQVSKLIVMERALDGISLFIGLA